MLSIPALKEGALAKLLEDTNEFIDCPQYIRDGIDCHKTCTCGCCALYIGDPDVRRQAIVGAIKEKYKNVKLPKGAKDVMPDLCHRIGTKQESCDVYLKNSAYALDNRGPFFCKDLPCDDCLLSCSCGPVPEDARKLLFEQSKEYQAYMNPTTTTEDKEGMDDSPTYLKVYSIRGTNQSFGMLYVSSDENKHMERVLDIEQPPKNYEYTSELTSITVPPNPDKSQPEYYKFNVRGDVGPWYVGPSMVEAAKEACKVTNKYLKDYKLPVYTTGQFGFWLDKWGVKDTDLLAYIGVAGKDILCESFPEEGWNSLCARDIRVIVHTIVYMGLKASGLQKKQFDRVASLKVWLDTVGTVRPDMQADANPFRN